MLKERELTAMMTAVADVVKEFVAEAKGALEKRIDALTQRFEALPVPKDGADADPAVIRSMVAEAVAEIPPAKDGKDADPAVIKAMVDEAVSAIPPAKDGQSVTLSDVAPLIDEAVSKRVAELPVPKDGERGDDGKDGKDADEAAIAQAISEGIEKALPAAVQKALDGILPSIVEKVVAAIPVPRDGVDGKSPDEAQILASVTEKMLRAVEALPKPVDGRDGRDAPEVDLDAVVMKVLPLIPKPKDGVDGQTPEVDMDAIVLRAVELIPVPQDGKGVTADELRPMVDEVVTRAVAALPTPKDGADADPEAVAEMVKAAVDAIPKPQDGKSVTVDELRPILDAGLARWELEFERRAADVMQGAIDKAVGSIPIPKDGVDGFSPDDFDVTLDGRVFTFALRCGDRVVTKQIKVPFPVDKGVYRSGAAYERGDTITFGGSQWIALKDTTAAPPSDSWRLCVKKGKDGKGSS